MRYYVEIAVVGASGPDPEAWTPTFRLPRAFASPRDAARAASRYLLLHNYGQGQATWKILDHDGSEVVDAEPERTASKG